MIWSRHKADIVLFLVLVAAAIKYTADVDRALDVEFYDESLYLLAGVKLASWGLHCPQCGPLFAPLYNGWYFLLSFLTSDNVSLYWLNYRVVTIVPPLLAYVLLRKNNASLLVSTAVAVLVLTSAANIPVWPKVSHFGIIILLLFLIPASTARPVPLVLSLGALAALLTSYARPEYFLTFLLLLTLLVTGIVLRREWRVRQHLFGPNIFDLAMFDFGAVALVGAAIIAVIGLPVSGYRSLCAFGQHFSIHWVAWTGSALDPWDDWQTVILQNFGQVHGMMDLVRNNPHLFLQHVEANFTGMLNNFHMAFPTYLFGDKISKLAIAVVMGLVFYKRWDVVRLNFHRYRTYLVVVGSFLLAGVISILIVYPRPHYFEFPVLLLITTFGILLSGRIDRRDAPEWKQVVILSLLILAATPSPYIRTGDEAQSNIRTIRLVQGLHIARPVNVLDSEGGIEAYLGNNYLSVDQSEKNTGFREFLATRKIGMVILTQLLATDIRFRGDSEFHDFLQHAEKWGFTRMPITGTDFGLFIRNDLMPGKQ